MSIISSCTDGLCGAPDCGVCGPLQSYDPDREICEECGLQVWDCNCEDEEFPDEDEDIEDDDYDPNDDARSRRLP